MGPRRAAGDTAAPLLSPALLPLQSRRPLLPDSLSPSPLLSSPPPHSLPDLARPTSPAPPLVLGNPAPRPSRATARWPPLVRSGWRSGSTSASRPPQGVLVMPDPGGRELLQQRQAAHVWLRRKDKLEHFKGYGTRDKWHESVQDRNDFNPPGNLIPVIHWLLDT